MKKKKKAEKESRLYQQLGRECLLLNKMTRINPAKT